MVIARRSRAGSDGPESTGDEPRPAREIRERMSWLLLLLLGLLFGVISALPMGPVGVLIFRNTLRGRRRQALFLIVGQTGAIFSYVTLVTIGMEGLLLDHPGLFHAIAFVGALLVSLLGVMTLRTAHSGAARDAVQDPNDRPEAVQPGAPARRFVLTGFSIALTNPGILFLLLTSISVNHSLLGGELRGPRLAVYLLFVLAGIEGWFLTVVAFLPRLIRRPSFKERLLRYLEWVAGSLLLAFGLFLFIKEGSALLRLITG